MTTADFEKQVAEQFPAIAADVADDEGLVHLITGWLYCYTQSMIRAANWNEVDRVFRFLETAYKTSQPSVDIENALRVSYLEYFEFQGHESRIRKLLGSELEFLYDDHMKYMERLNRAATARDEMKPDKG